MCRHHLELMLYPRKDSRQVSNHINEIEDITDGLRVSGSRRGLISMATEFDFGAFLLTENQFSPKCNLTNLVSPLDCNNLNILPEDLAEREHNIVTYMHRVSQRLEYTIYDPPCFPHHYQWQ